MESYLFDHNLAYEFEQNFASKALLYGRPTRYKSRIQQQQDLTDNEEDENVNGNNEDSDEDQEDDRPIVEEGIVLSLPPHMHTHSPHPHKEHHHSIIVPETLGGKGSVLGFTNLSEHAGSSVFESIHDDVGVVEDLSQHSPRLSPATMPVVSPVETQVPPPLQIDESDPFGDQATSLELVRDNEKYGVFFKMCRMGVPPPAVKNKMIQKNCNPAILDLGEEASMTKVLKLERQYEAEQLLAKKPAKKGETIHWEVIPEDVLLGKETVFCGTDFELEPATLTHIADCLDLFKTLPTDAVGSEDPKKSNNNKRVKEQAPTSVLDGRRAQAISIAMKKLKISAMHAAKFTWALREMNETVLNSQTVEVLLSCPLWPISEEEKQVLKARQEKDERMADTDKLILFVIDTVPDVAIRVNAMAFRWEFEESLIEVVKAVHDVKVLSKMIPYHNSLKLVIRSCVLVGNAINAESGQPIKGCSLHSLTKLGFTKTPKDKKMTILDCVAQYCHRCYPLFMQLSDLLPLLHICKKIELESHLKAMKDMRRGVDAIRKMRQLETFAYEALRRLDLVDNELLSIREHYDRALQYFGLSSNAMDTNMFFEQLLGFVEIWEKACDKVAKEEKVKAAAVLSANAAKEALRKKELKEKLLLEKKLAEEEEIMLNGGKVPSRKTGVQFKALFTRKPNVVTTKQSLTKLGSKKSVLTSGEENSPKKAPSKLPAGLAQELIRLREKEDRLSDLSEFSKPTKSTTTTTRKSIFFKGGESAVATGPAKKGRKSVFWG